MRPGRRWPAGRVDAAVEAAAFPVLIFLSAKLAVLVANLWWFPTLRGTAFAPAGVDRAALLVPLRDEADRIPETLPGMLAAGFGEVVLLDDGSTDGTAGTVARLLAEAPTGIRARLVTGIPRPAGWAGKTWACAQLAGSDPHPMCRFTARGRSPSTRAACRGLYRPYEIWRRT